MRSTQTQVLSFLATLSLLPQQSNAQAVYGMSVTPIAAYDSRWNGIAEGAVGSNGYMRDINGAPVLTSIWETSYDTIWSQAGVDVFFEAEQHLDLNNYSGTVPNPINILNFQSGQGGEETIYFNQANAGFEAAVAGFGSTTGSAKTHLTLFSNSYSNATPLNPGSPPDKPLDGGLTGFSASGLAATPNPGTVNPMRSIMATGDGVTAANEGGFNSPSGLPTTLAHELGHNGSLPHINGTRPSDVASEHYDPARSESLMFTGAGTGTQNVLNAGEVADALRTLEVNETLALKAGQTGTFWDSNGTTAGYGGAGTWDGTAANFGRPSGTGTSGAWVGDQVAVFRASGNYAVTVSGTQTATGIAVQQGNPTFGGAGSIDLTNSTASVDGVPEIFVESGVTATFDAVITGGGTEALTKLGAGKAVLNGTNTYTGGTQIRNGELQGDTSSILGNVELVNGSNATITTVLNLNQSVDGSSTGDITGDGDEVRKTGAGWVTLWSANLSYSGGTNVDAGGLRINGNKSGTDAVNVASGASLGGSGSISGSTTIDGSLDLRSGDTGTISFTTNLDYNPGSSTYFEFDLAGTADHVFVGGLLSLDGEIRFSDLGHTFSSGESFDLFDWGTSDFTAFAVATDLDPFLPNPGAGLVWRTDQFTVDGSIMVVPEPGSATLLGLAGWCFVLRRRKRTT